MGHFGEAKLATMVDKFGVPVVLTHLGADYEGKGIRDEVDETMFDGDTRPFVGRVVSVTVRTGDFPAAGLVEGGAFEVDGVAHTILSARRAEDGAVTRIFCSIA